MALRTHENFKSVDPNISDANVIFDKIGLAIMYQHMFERRTTPWEKSLWNDEELQNFTIELEDIDRLYYIYHEDGGDGQDFEMAARLEYKGKPIYVELSAGCDFTGFDCQGHGVIFISGDANLFMKLILTEKYQKDLIYQSLEEDGIYIEEQTEHDRFSRVRWSSAPMLKIMCHNAVYDNQNQLEHYPSVLPNILKESVDDFIKVREAKESYEDWD